MATGLLVTSTAPTTATAQHARDRVETAKAFRQHLRAGEYGAAQALLTSDPRRWFETREGEGRKWRIGPENPGPWQAWDREFNSKTRDVDWRTNENAAVLTVRETNDYFRLLERGWVTTEHVYYFEESGRISGFLIRANGKRPPGRTPDFLAWARQNAPEELAYLMPGGGIDPSNDRPGRHRALLEAWRCAEQLNDESIKIKRLIESAYIDVVYRLAPLAQVEKALAPEFRMYFYHDSRIGVRSKTEWLSRLREARASNVMTAADSIQQARSRTHRFRMIDVTEYTAVAKFDIFFAGNPKYTDYLTLYKTESSGWQIITKQFTSHP